jgi:hypothetical protein
VDAFLKFLALVVSAIVMIIFITRVPQLKLGADSSVSPLSVETPN